MKGLRYLAGLLFMLWFCSKSEAQHIYIHSHADSFAITNFRQQAQLEARQRARRLEDRDDRHAPGRFRVPIGGHIVNEDSMLSIRHPLQINPLTASLSPAENYPGLVDDLAVVPPDVQGAAGLNYLMETLNSEVRITDKSNNTVVSTVSLTNFWPSSWNTDPDNDIYTDPRIFYDPYGARWIFIMDFVVQNAHSGNLSNGQIFVAVSATDDPTGDWYDYQIVVDPTNQTWADFPFVGFSPKWIVITGNMFQVNGDNYEPSKIWALDKSSFYAGGAGSYTAIIDDTISIYNADTVGVEPSVVPAATYDSTTGKHYLMQTWDGAQGMIKLSAIEGAVGSESLVTIAYIKGSASWASGVTDGYDDIGPQKGSSVKVSVNWDDMLNVVYRNGHLWCTHNIFLPTDDPVRCSAQWWEVDTLGNIIQRSRVDDPTNTNFYAFPSIAVNSQNDAMLGYTDFSTKAFPSAAYSYRSNCDPVNTMDSTYIYKAGDTAYFKTWDNTSRWGDETATVVDPSNDVNMWTLQEYAASDTFEPDENAVEGRWSTQWAEITPTVLVNGGPGTWTWTGVYSTSWFNPCNWDQGTLPNSQSDVVVPGGTTYNPTVTGSPAFCNTLQVNSAAGGIVTVNMPGGGLLTVSQ